MNEKLKKIGIVIGSFFAGVFTIICGLLHYRRTDDRIADRIQRAEDGERNVAEGLNNATDIVGSLEEGIGKMQDGATESGNRIEKVEGIFEQIQRQKIR
ncbi:MAG: hypothetical protein MJ179_02680 [Treponema sp.]|nr:hypothetical protein [Treponema sp.]